jgi:hypothetical protein
LYPQADASFFILGTQVHSGIARAITESLDLDQTITHITSGISGELERANTRIVETQSRTIAGIYDDATRLITAWFSQVHPDSNSRLPEYGLLKWPAVVEQKFTLPASEAGTRYPVTGTIDAIFERQSGRHAIVDWKCGTRTQRSDAQLQHYRMISRLGDADAWFHNLDKPRAIIQHAEEYNEAAARQRAIGTEGVKTTMLDREYPIFNPGPLCGTCVVWAHCPARRGSRNDREANASDLRIRLRQIELVA